MTQVYVNNKTYREHERRIEIAVQRAITEKVINLSVTDVCNSAKISRQTFYIHYRSVNDVQGSQERRLQNEFKQRIGIAMKREVIFTITLSFMKDNFEYFSATLNRKDLKMLAWMIDYVRPRLVPKGTAVCSYWQYRSNLKSIIQIWVVLDKFSKRRMPLYVQELTRLRMMRSRLDSIRSFPELAIYSSQI